MLPISSSLRFFLYSDSTDMRKSFDGLSGLVSSALKQDPLSGDVFVFINRRKDRIKLLVWDRDGFWLFYKRLEQGTFQFPLHSTSPTSMPLSYDQLMCILEGIDLTSIKRRRRYQQHLNCIDDLSNFDLDKL
jgi:transposase